MSKRSKKKEENFARAICGIISKTHQGAEVEKGYQKLAVKILNAWVNAQANEDLDEALDESVEATEKLSFQMACPAHRDQG